MSNQVFNIFQKPNFDDSIRKVETRTYYPYVRSFGYNDIVEITVNQADCWFLMSESSIDIKGKIEKTNNENGEILLAPNAGAFLFDSITFEQCGKEVDSVRDPGRVSTIRGYLCYDPVTTKDLVIAGWNYPTYPVINSEDKSFRMIIPLKHMLSIFNDYNMVMCGKQTIRLVRSRSDNDCLIIKDNKTTAKIIIESIELKVKHIFPNDDLKLKLLQAIKQDTPIIMPFRKWKLHELPALKTGATREIWSVKTSSAEESPRYIIIAFQTNRYGNLSANPTEFDHINITNIRLTLNSDYWPNERMALDFSKNEYSEIYKTYTDFYPSYADQKHPLVDYVAFKTRPLFVIDCSRREESMKSSTVDIKLDIEAQTGFPENTRVICIVIHDSIMEFHPLSEIVRSIY